MRGPGDPDAGPLFNTVGLVIVTNGCSEMLRMDLAPRALAEVIPGVPAGETLPVVRLPVAGRTSVWAAISQESFQEHRLHWSIDFAGQASFEGRSGLDARSDDCCIEINWLDPFYLRADGDSGKRVFSVCHWLCLCELLTTHPPIEKALAKPVAHLPEDSSLPRNP